MEDYYIVLISKHLYIFPKASKSLFTDFLAYFLLLDNQFLTWLDNCLKFDFNQKNLAKFTINGVLNIIDLLQTVAL